MKKYKISVNGRTYDVEVEEVSSAEQRNSSFSQTAAPTSVSTGAPLAGSEKNQSVPSPSAGGGQSQAPSSSQAVAAPSRAEQPAGAPSALNALSVKAPMPGTVMSFKVAVGQRVKRGDVLLILEAMKMENDIVAPQDGRVSALRVAANAAVNTGDPLVDIE